MTPFLSEPTRTALEGLAEAERHTDAVQPIERIRAIRSLLAALESEPATLAAVRDALDSEHTWDEIADAAGLKPAATKWRWQGTDEQIAARQDAGRKRSARPSNVPTGLPGQSVAEAAKTLGVTVQAIYLQIRRGKLQAETVQLPDGRKYKRVHLGDSTPQ